MTSDSLYSIKEIPPGLVRAGLDDFFLIYEERERKIEFYVQGVLVDNADANGASSKSKRLAYVVKIPQSLEKGRLLGEQLVHRNQIIERLRKYIFDEPGIAKYYASITLEG